MARRENGAASGGGEPAGFPSLASLPAPTVSKQADTKPLDICVVTSEILGPIKNGGIGTATSALADHLAAHGHRVSVLYTQVWGGRPVCHEGDWDDWVTKLWEKGIRLIAIKHDGPWNAWREKSLAVRRFLESQPFNLVYLNEHHASGFYALLAKRAGLTPFKDQTYAVITHGSMEWVSRTNDQPLVHPNDIAMALMERRCVEWADAVIGPSAYLLRTYQSYGWTLPNQTFVQPYLLGSADTKTQRRAEPIDELVFFGRLEHRKGLWMFCQALDRLAAQGKTPNVTFMGRMTPTGNVPSGAFLLNRAADWPFRVRLLTEFGQEDALAYLKQPGKLAVMPSLADNSPCVVYEAIELGLPFVTCSGSGADEIIHPRDHKVALVEPTAEALADRLADCLENGAKAARLAFDPSRNQKAWEHWHATISAKTKAASAGVVSAGVASAGAISDTKKSSKTQAPHLLLIDDPGEPLGQIFETIAENAKSFGSTGSISFLTPRQGDLGDWIDQILDLIAQGTAMDIRRVTTSNASQAVKGKACTVVTSVSARLAAPLIRHAADLVSRNKDTVFSYLLAGRADHPTVRDHSLPHGDIAALAVYGEPLTGGLCIGPGKAVANQLASAVGEVERSGDWLEAAAFCEQLVLNHLTKGGTYHLVPQIAATFGTLPIQRPREPWHSRARNAMDAAGFDYRKADDLAVWTAVSGFWADRARKRQGSGSAPYQSPSVGDVVRKAVSTGHLSAALELTARLPVSEIETVKQAAVDSLASIPAFDFLPRILAAALGGQTSPPSGSAVPTAVLGSSNPAIEHRKKDSSIALAFPPGEAAQSVLVAFDLVLDRQSVLEVLIERPGMDTNSAAMTAQLEILDQKTGTPVVPATGPTQLSNADALCLSLGRIKETVTLLLSLECSERDVMTEVQITAIGAR